MPDLEPVIGLVRNGKALAIRKISLSSYNGHIQIYPSFGSGVTVVHCDRSDCTRIFDSTGIGIKIIGFHHGLQTMMVSVEGKKTALKEIGNAQFTDTTWGEWRKKHPDGLVMDLDEGSLTNYLIRLTEEAENKEQ